MLCHECRGRGRCRECDGEGEDDAGKECEECRGTGNCPECKDARGRKSVVSSPGQTGPTSRLLGLAALAAAYLGTRITRPRDASPRAGRG